MAIFKLAQYNLFAGCSFGRTKVIETIVTVALLWSGNETVCAHGVRIRLDLGRWQ